MRVAAVDLGASSVRVAVVDLAAPSPSIEIVHRHRHQPRRDGAGSLRWDWEQIVRQVEEGLGRAMAAGPLASIGVDGWGVDYGLVDRRGRLVAAPFAYRDERTSGWEELVARIGRERIYQITGIQLQPFNTLFQLAVHHRAELEGADRLLLLPDLLAAHLTAGSGSAYIGAERSNASTTAMLDADTGGWSRELVAAVGVDEAMLPPLVAAGDRLGSWQGVPVVAVGSHDTASAFLAAPGPVGEGTALVSCGTWALVGAERERPLRTADALALNFTNEAGAFGGVRLLKNVAGLYLLERCIEAWGIGELDLLLAEAAALGPVPFADAADPRFLAPADMVAEVKRAAGLEESAPPAAVVRSVLESIAAGVTAAVTQLSILTGVAVSELMVVGGGGRIPLLLRLLEDHTGVAVVTGSSEATALGNALAQGVASGRFEDLDSARRWAAGSRSGMALQT
jgi:rhamnulokinase